MQIYRVYTLFTNLSPACGTHMAHPSSSLPYSLCPKSQQRSLTPSETGHHNELRRVSCYVMSQKSTKTCSRSVSGIKTICCSVLFACARLVEFTLTNCASYSRPMGYYSHMTFRRLRPESRVFRRTGTSLNATYSD